MARPFSTSRNLSKECKEAFRSTWVTKGFQMNAELDQLISKTYSTDSLMKAIRGSPLFTPGHERLLCLAESNLKIAKATIKHNSGNYPQPCVDHLRSTFLAIGSDFVYASEGITVGKKLDERPLSMARAEAKIMSLPRKAKATTKTTKEPFTLVSSPLTRHVAPISQNVPGAFPTPLNRTHRNLSLVNLNKHDKAVEDARTYDPDEDPELDVVTSEEVEWDLVSEDDDGKDVEGEDFVVLGKE